MAKKKNQNRNYTPQNRTAYRQNPSEKKAGEQIKEEVQEAAGEVKEKAQETAGEIKEKAQEAAGENCLQQSAVAAHRQGEVGLKVAAGKGRNRSEAGGK